MSASRAVRLVLALSVCCLLSVLAVTAVSDEVTPPIAPPVPVAPAYYRPPSSSSGEAAVAVPRPPSAATSPSARPPAASPAVTSPRSPTYRPYGSTGPYHPSQYAPPPPDPKKTAVMLKDGSRLVGELAVPDELKIKTEYGEVRIPKQSISYIYWQRSPEKSIVQTRNGDRMTGTLDEMTLKLTAVWGNVSIDTKHVVCVYLGGGPNQYAYPSTAVYPTTGGGHGWSPTPYRATPYRAAPSPATTRYTPSRSYIVPKPTPSTVEPKIGSSPYSMPTLR